MAIIIKNTDMPKSCCDCFVSANFCDLWEKMTDEECLLKRHSKCPIIEISDEDCHTIETLKESGETVKGALSLLVFTSLLKGVDTEYRKSCEGEDKKQIAEIFKYLAKEDAMCILFLLHFAHDFLNLLSRSVVRSTSHKVFKL